MVITFNGPGLLRIPVRFTFDGLICYSVLLGGNKAAQFLMLQSFSTKAVLNWQNEGVPYQNLLFRC